MKTPSFTTKSVFFLFEILQEHFIMSTIKSHNLCEILENVKKNPCSNNKDVTFQIFVTKENMI